MGKEKHKGLLRKKEEEKEEDSKQKIPVGDINLKKLNSGIDKTK